MIGNMKKALIGVAVCGGLMLGAVPAASAATSGVEGVAGCGFITSKPSIDYNYARKLTAKVGRSGCSNYVSWLHGSLRRDMPGKNDTILARFDKYNVNQYSQTLSSWATQGHVYFSFASSSTGNSQVSAMTTSK